MRSTDEVSSEIAEAWFAGDLENGDTEVECGACGEINIAPHDMPYDVRLLCSGCHKELVYRPWFNW